MYIHIHNHLDTRKSMRVPFPPSIPLLSLSLSISLFHFLSHYISLTSLGSVLRMLYNFRKNRNREVDVEFFLREFHVKTDIN